MRITTTLTPLLLTLFLSSLAASCLSGGTIERGRKYGVEIGMTYEEANAILVSRGMLRLRETHASNVGCAARFRQPDETVIIYSRRGDGFPPVSCLFTIDNRVVVIAWEAY